MLRSLNKFFSDFILKQKFLKCVAYKTKLNSNKAIAIQSRSYIENKTVDVKVVALHRSIIRLSGDDVSEFLQGLVTNDVNKLHNEKCMYAMILNSKGRVMHDIIMYSLLNNANTVLLECQTESVSAVMKMLKLYKLRKKVEISSQEDIKIWQAHIHHSFAYPFQINPENLNDYFSPPLFVENLHPLNDKNVLMVTPDPRLNWLGWRILSTTQPCLDEYIGEEEIYHNFRYFFGIPEGPGDLNPGKSLPLESNVDYMNGISFDKGCYLGQELTARSHFTGMIRKRLVPVIIQASETSIKTNENLYDKKGNKSGKFIKTADGKFGLALIKLSRQNVLLSTLQGVQVYANKTFWWPNPK